MRKLLEKHMKIIYFEHFLKEKKAYIRFSHFKEQN
jgi:hypothetical protein